MRMMQVNNIYLNQVKKQSFIIITLQGIKSIEPKTLNALFKWTDHYSLLKSQVAELEGHKNTIVKRSITYCHDVNGIIELTY